MIALWPGQLTAVTRRSAAHGVTMFVVYVHTPTREDSAPGVCRTAVRSAASGVGSGLTRGARFETLDWLTGYPDVIS